MKQVITGIIVGITLLTSMPVLADRGEERHGEIRHGEVRHWQGREIHRFGERDFEIWRGGRWFHGRHGGQRGWWWITAGIWYFYPAPVYPYPDPYTPAVVIQQNPMLVEPQAPVVVAPQAPAPAQAQQPVQNWYYCESAKAYYPYVSSCAEGWKSVPAQPQGAPR